MWIPLPFHFPIAFLPYIPPWFSSVDLPFFLSCHLPSFFLNVVARVLQTCQKLAREDKGGNGSQLDGLATRPHRSQAKGSCWGGSQCSGTVWVCGRDRRGGVALHFGPPTHHHCTWPQSSGHHTIKVSSILTTCSLGTPVNVNGANLAWECRTENEGNSSYTIEK